MQSGIEILNARLRRPEPLRWVFAGDSITHGAFHTGGWRDYVELFGERVRWELQRRRDCVIKTGISGWRIGDLLADLQWSALQHRPDVLLMMFGMNDCTAGSDGVAAFVAAYEQVIAGVRGAAAAADDVLFVLQTPNRILPADDRRFPHLSDYAAAVRELAERRGAILVDHHSDWEQAERAGTVNYWLHDAIHPNAVGHRALARSLCRHLDMWDPASLTGRLFIT